MSVPARRSLAAYDRTWLRGDVMAGITLAAYLLPSARKASQRSVPSGLNR